jgi:hypothetical protein
MGFDPFVPWGSGLPEGGGVKDVLLSNPCVHVYSLDLAALIFVAFFWPSRSATWRAQAEGRLCHPDRDSREVRVANEARGRIIRELKASIVREHSSRLSAAIKQIRKG